MDSLLHQASQALVLDGGQTLCVRLLLGQEILIYTETLRTKTNHLVHAFKLKVCTALQDYKVYYLIILLETQKYDKSIFLCEIRAETRADESLDGSSVRHTYIIYLKKPGFEKLLPKAFKKIKP